GYAPGSAKIRRSDFVRPRDQATWNRKDVTLSRSWPARCHIVPVRSRREADSGAPPEARVTARSWVVFKAEERGRVREKLLARAEADGAVTGAAFTGSLATGDSDRWSDTDLVLAVRGEVTPVLNEWTHWLYRELGAQHHWDLPVRRSVVRVFLLPG